MNPEHKICIVSLGSNTDSLYTINKAIEELTLTWPNIEFSTKVYTQPIGLPKSGPFLNLVGQFRSTLVPSIIIATCKEIETKLGRDRKDPNHIVLDIDLIQWGNEVLKPKDFEYEHIREGIKELNNKNMKFIGIIPARYASTRFPAKPLAILGGKPVIQRVYEQVASVLDAVYVATDDVRIQDAVLAFGGKVVMTSPDHQSGTDRCYEAYLNIDQEYDVVINIQGDEPFIQKSQIEALMSCFKGDDSTDIATLVKPFGSTNSLEELENPNSPKVVLGVNNRALYFSRSVIPYLRNIDKSNWLMSHRFFKHIGLYAYRSTVLAEITKLKQSPLELAESLEQLRWLENGYAIKVAETSIETIGIDTPHDLERAEVFLKNKN